MTTAGCSWLQKKSPWCRIVIGFIAHFGVDSFQDVFDCKQICFRKRTCGGAGGVRNPSGGWSSSSHLLIFPKILEFTSKHGRVRKRLQQTQRMTPRKLRKDTNAPPAVWLNTKMIFPSFLSRSSSIFPLPW